MMNNIAPENLIAWVASVICSTPGRFQQFSNSFPAALLMDQPAPGEWSALECLQHLIDTERVFQSRIRALLAGQDFPAFDPATQGAKLPSEPDMAALVQEFSHLREQGVALLQSLTFNDLTRQGRHAELGMVTLSNLLHEWGGHDLMHTVQAERAVMQPFIGGCGPWHIYFTDHIQK